jgi:hypothetical protein
LAATKSADEISLMLDRRKRLNDVMREQGLRMGVGHKGGLNPGYAARAVGGHVAGPAGYAVGAIGSNWFTRQFHKGGYATGKFIERMQHAPADVKAKLERLAHINGKSLTGLEASNGITRMALVNLAQHDPAVMAWLREQNNAVQK